MQTREINQKINQTIRRDIVKAKEQSLTKEKSGAPGKVSGAI